MIYFDHNSIKYIKVIRKKCPANVIRKYKRKKKKEKGKNKIKKKKRAKKIKRKKRGRTEKKNKEEEEKERRRRRGFRRSGKKRRRRRRRTGGKRRNKSKLIFHLHTASVIRSFCQRWPLSWLTRKKTTHHLSADTFARATILHEMRTFIEVLTIVCAARG